MDAWDIIVVCVRRWMMFIPVFALGLLASVVVSTTMETQYRASAAMILIGPHPLVGADDAGDGNDDEGARARIGAADEVSENAYLALGLSVLADVVRRAVDGSEGRREIAARGLSTDYDVFVSPRASIVDVEARAPSAADATATLDGVLALLDDELARRQTAVHSPADVRASLQTVTRDAEATPDGESTLRVIGILAALAAVVAAAVTVTDDIVRRRRDARRERELARFRRQLRAWEEARRADARASPSAPIVRATDAGGAHGAPGRRVRT